MNAEDMVDETENERREFAEAFERAHAAGEVSDRHFARARIDGALAGWHLQAYKDAGRPEPVPDNLMDGRPPIERVGIPAVDAALPHTTQPAHVFLNALSYLMRESDDALEIAGARAKDCDEAAALLRRAAALLKGKQNEPLGHLVESLAPWAERGKFGRVFVHKWESGHLYAKQYPDSLSASLKGKGGKPARDGAIVRALVQLFPNEQGFFTNGGNTLISRLALLCGATKATPQYVLSTLEQGRRTAPKHKAPAKAATPDNSLLRLFRKS
ncbi:hypothetical protein HF289_16910 [Acidithiobacillus ferrooxidans]|uniref:hypothetical protein n=1 Tax=Acidithiobacillus ferrooxidans TaxID=920 RepID=UPI001C06DFCA|nr:hypothetical protein [Acidithiobacillus ferrooxidans]MBU2858460.1 hypothetical protein [Acidithiobacillus ferrooxidans]MBU2861856.1 hypothetical protein [Acidithiobacillus ferrooxidans]